MTEEIFTIPSETQGTLQKMGDPEGHETPSYGQHTTITDLRRAMDGYTGSVQERTCQHSRLDLRGSRGPYLPLTVELPADSSEREGVMAFRCVPTGEPTKTQQSFNPIVTYVAH